MTPELLAQFDNWERRARGFTVSDYVVQLEPPFEALLPTAVRVDPIDDGRRPGFLAGLFRGNKSPKPASPPPSPQELAPLPQPAAPAMVELQLRLPEELSVKPAYSAALFATLHNLSHQIAFELIGLPEGIVIQLVCAAGDEPAVSDAIQAYFPEVRIRANRNFLRDRWFELPRYASIVDFGLYHYCMHPLQANPANDPDPLVGLFGALNSLEQRELALLQVLTRPAVMPWSSELWRFAQLTDECSALESLIKTKFSTSPCAAVIRVAALGFSPHAAFSRARMVGNALLAATRSEGNELIPLSNEGYPDSQHETDVLRRESHRTGMILSSGELLTLVHLPSMSVKSERLRRNVGRSRPVPAAGRDGPMLLGLNDHEGDIAEVRLRTDQRLRHTYVIGASGTGKSTLLLSMMLQDIAAGEGVALLDPHGDLVEAVIANLPDNRLADVVLVDPADTEFPVGFNLLSAESELERTVLSSDFVEAFKRLSTSWGDQMTAVLGNALLALLESPASGTLLDLRRFLVDDVYRQKVIPTIADPEIAHFWTREYPLLKGFPQAPLLTRLDAFLRPKAIRYMVAQSGNKLRFREVIERKSILLVKLSQGEIGEENSYLLGSLVVAKFAQAAASRQNVEHAKRHPFFLYIDEFQNYVTPSLAQLLSGVRKYGIGLTLANQDLRQIRSRSEDLAASVLGNAATRVVFRVADADAKVLCEGLSYFEPRDVANLETGRAIVRLERGDWDFNLQTQPPSPLGPDIAAQNRKIVVDQSRARYAMTRQDVEAMLASHYAADAPEPAFPRRQRASEGRAVHEPTGLPNPPQPVRAPTPRPAKPAARPPESPGRGGPQHRYLQSLIKRIGEDFGFRAVVERPVLGGAGHVDVALEREGLSVGCEISITTDVQNEVKNLRKCLAAGFDYAILVSGDPKVLRAAEATMIAESADSAPRIRIVTPEAFPDALGELSATAAERNTTIHGYRVKVKYRNPSDAERQAREALLSDVIARGLKRNRDKR